MTEVTIGTIDMTFSYQFDAVERDALIRILDSEIDYISARFKNARQLNAARSLKDLSERMAIACRIKAEIWKHD